MRRRTATWAAAVVTAATAAALAQQGTGGGQWMRYGGDAGNTKYAPLDQIDRNNVSRLRIAWKRPAIDASLSSKAPNLSYSNNFRATPLMICAKVYVQSRSTVRSSIGSS